MRKVEQAEFQSCDLVICRWMTTQYRRRRSTIHKSVSEVSQSVGRIDRSGPTSVSRNVRELVVPWSFLFPLQTGTSDHHRTQPCLFTGSMAPRSR